MEKSLSRLAGQPNKNRLLNDQRSRGFPLCAGESVFFDEGAPPPPEHRVEPGNLLFLFITTKRGEHGGKGGMRDFECS